MYRIYQCIPFLLPVATSAAVRDELTKDLKPENLMMFNGRLKLIDVDGCVPIDSEVGFEI